MPEPSNFIVGRTREVEQFSKLVKGETRHWMFNIYGPGGIGKTVVGRKMQVYAKSASVPIAFIDGIQPDLTPDRILFEIKDGLAQTESLVDSFRDFDRQFEEHLIIQEVLQRGGGMQSMFDAVGNVADPTGFAQVVTSLGKTLTEEVKRIISNRFAMERYLRGTEKLLTGSLSTSLSAATEKAGRSLAIIVDTYEELEGLDDWFCRILTPAIPNGVKLIVLGRNSLAKINFDWAEHGQTLYQMELSELEE